MEKKILTAAIAAQYIGVMVMLDGKKQGTLVGVSTYDKIIQVRDGENNLPPFYLNAEGCQLDVKPRLAISDADAIHVCLLGGQDRSDDVYKINQGRALVNEYWNRQSNVDASQWIEITRYLCLKGYDCGGPGITSLIEAGIGFVE